MSDYLQEAWILFKNHLIEHDGEEIPDGIINQLFRDLDFVKVFPKNTNIHFFRARCGKYANADESQMLNPPKETATAGRCNKEGVSYLYLSNTERTAMEEALKENNVGKLDITIAEFDVDMSNVFSFLPYKFDYMNRVVKREETNSLLRIINEEMQCVIKDKKEYIPLQYISELIKSKGYDGFLYGSVVDERGVNLVMYNINRCKMKNRIEEQIYVSEEGRITVM